VEQADGLGAWAYFNGEAWGGPTIYGARGVIYSRELYIVRFKEILGRVLIKNMN
jgi:hypothetical protein